MAAALWIVRRATTNKTDVIDGIETVIINNDDGDNEATTIADAEAALVAAGYPIPDGYFDSAAVWSASGQLDSDGDLIAMGQRIEVIA